MSGPLVEEDCHVLHVTVPALPVQAEVARRPELAGLPVVVHADGAVLAASAQARACGVRAGQPVEAALVRCGRAVPVAADPATYERLRAGVLAVLTEITPLVEPVGEEAAFVDVGGAVRRHGSPARIAWLVRDRLRARHGVGAAVGVGASKVVARLAAAAVGDDGVLLVPRAASARFLDPQPVTALPEVSGAVEVALAAQGIRRLGQLAAAPAPGLRQVLGPATGRWLQDLAWGRDPRPVVPPEASTDGDGSGVSVEAGCAQARGDRTALERCLRVLARDGAAALRARGRATCRLGLTVVTADGAELTRSRTLVTPTRGEHELHLVARSLLAAATWTSVPERLRIDLDALRELPGGTAAAGGAGTRAHPPGERRAGSARDPAGPAPLGPPARSPGVTLVPRPSTTTIVTADIS
ncbi:DNA polymerase IV [Cellulomonas sp. JZ18]|uniref:DNA polymerase Y family protein n=1 Tax=Cellulomonas sp. JZ18 TaxID=2654191 RepID=UPI0018AF6965|nr:DNA polymerase IV [Cellulomonas sp. JZ18]